MATDINILIKATDQATPNIKKVEGEVKKLGTTAKSSSSLMGGLGDVLKTGLTTALIGTAAAVGGVVFAFKDSLSAAKESIEAQKQLEAVIKSTGGAAGVTAEQATELATSLSQVTNFGDDTIVTGENMLLTFTNIGKDVFPRATETMLDMSQALGTDLKGSAIQLGKALNDPIAGISALSRVGVTFTEDQKAMIKAMMDANDVAGAQTVILDELAKEFGGSAKALADPAVQLANAWGEVQEAVGMGLVPILNDLALTVLPYVQAAAQAVSTAVTNFYKYLGDGMPVLEAIQQAVADVLPDDLKDKWNSFADGIQGTMNTIQGTIQNVMGWIRLAWDTDWGGIHTTWTNFATDLPNEQKTFWEAWSEVFNTGSKHNVNEWEGFFGDIFGLATSFWTLTLANFAQFGFALHAANKFWTDLFKGDWGAAWNDMKVAFNAVTEIILNNIEYIFGPGVRDGLATWLNATWEMLKSWWENVSGWWNNTIGALFNNPLPSLPTPNFAIVNPANAGGGSAGATGGTVNNITVNTTGGYDSGVAAGDGIVDAMRFRGH